MSERSIFIAALEKDDATLRAAYLDQACAGDELLRVRIERLLKAHEPASGRAGPEAGKPVLRGDVPYRAPWSEGAPRCGLSAGITPRESSLPARHRKAMDRMRHSATT